VPHIRGWMGGVGDELRLPSDVMGLVAVPNELSIVLKPHYKAKQTF